MKKLFSAFLICLLIFAFSLTALADDGIMVFLNGDIVDFKDQTPVISEGRTLVPLRGILEEMGAKVDWDGDTRTATVIYGDITTNITIGEKALYKNDEKIDLDVPAQLINSRTMVPIRAISESFGVKIGWAGDIRGVVISTDEILNGGISAISESKDFYWCGKGGIIYDDMPGELEMIIGRNSDKDISILGTIVTFKVDGATAKSEIFEVYKDGKVYTYKDGILQRETNGEDFFEGKPLLSFDQVFEKSVNTKAYGVYNDMYDGTYSVKIYADKDIPAEITYTAKTISAVLGDVQGVEFAEDIFGKVELDMGKTAKLYQDIRK